MFALLALLACGPADDAPVDDPANEATDPDPTLPEPLPSLFEGGEQGDPGVGSAYSLAFAPGGELVIGDGDLDRLVLVELPEDDAEEAASEVVDLYGALADALGTTAGNVQVWDVAVHPDSQRIFLSANEQIFTVHDGELELLDLSDVRWTDVPYPERSGLGSYVFDLVVTDGAIVAAVNEWTFGQSQVVVVDTPVLDGDEAVSSSTRTYHRTHRAWETTAPVTTLAAWVDDGAPVILASYSCAPVVRLELDALRSQEETVGVTPFDFGGGRQVMAMAMWSGELAASVYGLDGADGIAGAEVSTDLLATEAEVDEQAQVIFGFAGGSQAGGAKLQGALDDAWRFAVLDDNRAVVVPFIGNDLLVVER